MNMIEKVARAIRLEYEKQLSTVNGDSCFEIFCAKAAIEAMREPSEGMKEACLRLYMQDEKDGNNTKLKFNGKNLWKVMIDAALKEE